MAKDGGGLVARAVREALGTLVSPQLYAQLIARALQAAGLSDIPEQGSAIAQWIEGPLRREIESAVGADAAELVAQQLSPIVAHAAASMKGRSSERESGPAERSQRGRDAFASEQPTGVMSAPGRKRELQPTAKVRVPSSDPREAGHTRRPAASDGSELVARERARVLVASSAHAEIEALERHLEPTASVSHIADLVGLLDALDESSHLDPLVLLDCQRPTVHVTSIAAIGDDMPKGTTIVLWGGSDETWRELDRERTPNCRWVRCSNEATIGDVASLCAMLLGNR